MKFLKRIKLFLIYSLVLSILYIPNTGYAAWSGSAYSPGETLNPECAPTDSGCTVSLSFTASNGNIGIGSTTPWGKLSVNPNGITGPSFVIGSSTGTSFMVTNGGMVGIGTYTPTYVLEAKAPSSVSSLFKIQNSDYNNTDTGTALTMITGASSGNSYVRLQVLNGGGSTSGNMVLNSSGGNVGVGTTSPYAKLSVTNTSTNPSFIVEDSTSPDTTPFIIDTSGNVGIGTTTPSGILHLSTSGVDDNFFQDAFGGQNNIIGRRANGTISAPTALLTDNTMLQLSGRGYDGTSMGTGSKAYMQFNAAQNWSTTANGTYIRFFTTGNDTTTATERLRIDNTGNVGIGSTTPFATLAINPTAGNASNQFVVGSSTATSLVINNSGMVGIGTSNPGDTLNIEDSRTSNGAAAIYSHKTGNTLGSMYAVQGFASGAGSTNYGGHFSATGASTNNIAGYFNATGATNNYGLIVNNGNVGFGTTTPSSSYRLDAIGSIRAAVEGYGINNVGSGISVQRSTNDSQLFIGFRTTPDAWVIGSSYAITGSYKPIIFATSDTVRLNILTNGNIGIATTTPYAKLSVAGTDVATSTFAIRPVASQTANIADIYTSAGVLKDVISSANLWGLGTSSPSSKLSITQSANTPAGGLWIAETGNTDFRSIYMSDTSGTLSFFGGDTAGALNTATLSSAGTWTNASDRSYKENIANLDTKYNLNTLLSIQPRFYTMKGSGKPQIGFIAQELQPILPEVVEGTEGSLGISYGNMVALLVQAIKDINTKVDNIANKLSGVFKTDSVEANKVSTKELCVDDVCVSKEQFREMVVRSGMMPNIIHTNENNNTNQGSAINTPSTNNGTSTPQVENNATTTQVIENTATTTQITENNTNNQNPVPAEQVIDQNLNSNPVENQNTPTQ